MSELKAPTDAKGIVVSDIMAAESWVGYNLCTLSVAPHLNAIKAAVASCGDQLTPREHGYIRAVWAYASGNLLKATEELCSMLIQYPLGELFHSKPSIHVKNVINLTM